MPFGFNRRVLPFFTRWLAHLPTRRLTLTHLDFAYGDAMPLAEKKRIAKTIARNLGLVVAEVLASSRKKLPDGYIDFEQADVKAAEILGDHGFIGLTGHIANWELCGQSLAAYSERSECVIAKRLGNPGLNDLIEELREKLGMKTFYQNESPMHLVRILRQGKAIGTVPDQDVARIAGEFIPFFGRDAYTPTGPAILSMKGRVPIIVAIMRRRAGGGLDFLVHDPIWPDPKASDKKAEVLRITKAWSQKLEDAIRAQPSDWMWFHKRWETTPARLEERRLARMSEVERREREARSRASG